MTTPAQIQERLKGLVAAGIALSSELSLDDLLLKLAETAAALTGARYAALGVIDPSGTGLERFVHTGIDEATVTKIGDLPRGRGILGALITDARPLRLEKISDDPRSVGFPPHHPPMRGFLGVPILLRGRAFGNLYLAEKESESFTEQDEELVGTLASQAAVAIENARLYEAATSWSEQLEALNEVGTALASEIELARLLELIARRLRGLIDARLVTIALPAADGTLRIEAADGNGAGEIVGLQLERAGSKSGRVLERRRAERVDSLLDDPEVDQEAARRLGARSGLYVPLIVRRKDDRRDRRPRQGWRRRTLHRCRPASGRDLRSTRSCRGRPLRPCRRRRAASGRRGAGARAAPPCAGAARPDRAGADLGAARPEGSRGGQRATRSARKPSPPFASRSSRRCTTSAVSPSS